MEQPADEKPILPVKPRNSVIAFLLSLSLPGLGQVYNGQLRKGAFFLGLVLLIPFLFGITMYSTTFLGLLVAFMLELSLRLYAAIDGARVAKYQKDYILKPYNTWYYHLLIAIGMYAILIVYDILAFKTKASVVVVIFVATVEKTFAAKKAKTFAKTISEFFLDAVLTAKDAIVITYDIFAKKAKNHAKIMHFILL